MMPGRYSPMSTSEESPSHAEASRPRNQRAFRRYHIGHDTVPRANKDREDSSP